MLHPFGTTSIPQFLEYKSLQNESRILIPVEFYALSFLRTNFCHHHQHFFEMQFHFTFKFLYVYYIFIIG